METAQGANTEFSYRSPIAVLRVPTCNPHLKSKPFLHGKQHPLMLLTQYPTWDIFDIGLEGGGGTEKVSVSTCWLLNQV